MTIDPWGTAWIYIVPLEGRQYVPEMRIRSPALVPALVPALLPSSSDHECQSLPFPSKVGLEHL